MIKLMSFFEKLMHIILLNILFFLGTAIGLIAFGTMPALYAVNQTFKDEILFEPHSPIMPIIKNFFNEYKSNFLRINMIMIPYSILIIIILIDIYILQFNHSLNLLLAPLIVLLLYLVVNISFLLTVIDEPNGSILDKIKLVILAPLLNLKTSFLILLYLFISILIFNFYIPAFILLFPSLYIKMSCLASRKSMLNKELLISID
ncbi:MAG TPA: DUF624 domain-containing protein [Virgibacillus sp.]|nr:DUF624 domain-containing protein [Virgibacillus sp.]HLR67551.1 DUF624 domain-containing protein [Virgibacillus sp.]